jgi:hypothetical protein
MNAPAQLTEGEQLKQKVYELSQLILDKHPKMPTLLREIHTTIRKYPEQVTLLDDTDIGIIVSGLILQTQTVFASSAVSKTSKTSTKSIASKLSSLGADAL